ncbi:hypothetical protein GSB9_01713 [Flavobacteriaceae bacterium GSB9]|nr:hypothetical protein GSB9_01713 [Flavobacteriaceae bacterium GSB9]
MNIKLFTFIITCCIATTVFSQNSINNYKYVIVPKQYSFLKEPNQYQLNALTQFLFNKYGFEALMEGADYPEDLMRNRCLALNSDLMKESGLFKTKVILTLKDCNGQTVFTSKMGESREKDYRSAYNLALRDAFESIEALNYKFEPSENNLVIPAQNNVSKNNTSTEIAQLKQEIENLKKEKEAKIEKAPEKQVSTEEAESLKQAKQQEIKALVKSKFPKGNKPPMKTVLPATQTLYAQEIENGFQLVDRTPKVVCKIKKTGRENLFLVEGEDAIIYKSGDNWVYEYNTDEGVKQQQLNIKF